jgi:hypothetical protein
MACQSCAPKDTPVDRNALWPLPPAEAQGIAEWKVAVEPSEGVGMVEPAEVLPLIHGLHHTFLRHGCVEGPERNKFDVSAAPSRGQQCRAGKVHEHCPQHGLLPLAVVDTLPPMLAITDHLRLMHHVVRRVDGAVLQYVVVTMLPAHSAV